MKSSAHLDTSHSLPVTVRAPHKMPGPDLQSIVSRSRSLVSGASFAPQSSPSHLLPTGFHGSEPSSEFFDHTGLGGTHPSIVSSHKCFPFFA